MRVGDKDEGEVAEGEDTASKADGEGGAGEAGGLEE